MLGSPNFVRFVYDGDGSDSDPAGPHGSGEIERIFTSYFTGRGLRTKATPFDGRSDYGPFIDVGIPAGGLFSGAEGIKTKGEASVYDGTAGVAYDSCYHQACDTASNLNTTALSQLGDGDAHAVYRLATSDKDLYGDTDARALNARVKGPQRVR
jgi:Zn-dependent M28 family amino/carboxypeptidase